MPIPRRDFLTGVFASASLPITLSQFASAAQVAAQAGLQESAPANDFLDQKTVDFWTRVVRSGSERDRSDVPDPKRIPEFLIYTDDARGFRTISEIRDSELFSSGDATVSLWVNQLRPSTEDLERSKNLKVANLRIDLQQKHPLHPLLGVLSYSIMAALFSKKASSLPLPQVTDVSANGGTRLQNVPLPSGSGEWTWNIFTQHEESMLGKFIRFVIKEAIQFAPLLSFPAITTPGLHSIDSLYGYWQGRALSHWLFNDKAVDVYATKEAKVFYNPASAVPLVKGTYVLVPQVHLPKFKESQTNLVIQQGLLVPKGTDPKDVHVAANQVLPDVTYVTIAVSVVNSLLTGPRTAPKG